MAPHAPSTTDQSPETEATATRNLTGYGVILEFRHKGLKRLYEEDDPRSVQPDHVKKLGRLLTNLDVATKPADLDLPGYHLHPLTGDRRGRWSTSVSGNWRVTFRFESHDVTEVDYEDYH